MINKFNIFGDTDGCLLPIEFKDLNFDVKRIFVVNNTPINQIRGNHAHHVTKQLIVCLNGGVEVVLHDGIKESSFIIYKNEYVYVPELVWDYQKFLSDNSEILVICSTEYNQDDYIEDFDYFLKLKKI